MARVEMELSICDDCTIWIANADASGMDSERFGEVYRGVGHLSEIGYVVNACGTCFEDTCEAFSSRRCDCCQTSLAGTRHAAAILVDDKI